MSNLTEAFLKLPGEIRTLSLEIADSTIDELKGAARRGEPFSLQLSIGNVGVDIKTEGELFEHLPTLRIYFALSHAGTLIQLNQLGYHIVRSA